MLEMLTVEKYSAYYLLALGTLKTLPLSPVPPLLPLCTHSVPAACPGRQQWTEPRMAQGMSTAPQLLSKLLLTLFPDLS